MAGFKRLSEKSVRVLSLTAEGYSYAQIVDGHPEISYLDIFWLSRNCRDESQDRYGRVRKRFLSDDRGTGSLGEARWTTLFTCR